MTQYSNFNIRQFGGLKNDEDAKQIPNEFFSNMVNFTYPKAGVLGIEKMLAPSRIQLLESAPVDGIFEYRYLNSDNEISVENIVVCNGSIYSIDLDSTKTTLKSGLHSGLCTFAIYHDKLFIANGKDYVQIYNGNTGNVYEMGAPEANVITTVGSQNGTYFYAITYETAGGEEYLGSVSNTIVSQNRSVRLTLPIGYTGTTARHIYRNVNGSTAMYFVATISNNTATTYTDASSDASILTGASLPSVNNELPKPYFVASANNKIYGAVVDKYPTQVFSSETGLDLWDLASYIDISNNSSDNTPVTAMDIDFSNIVIGTQKNIYLLSSSDAVTTTRANVGIKNGYSVRRVPSFGSFEGGLMFLSSLGDIRVLSGVRALAVVNSIDNISSDNWAQNIRGSLDVELKTDSKIYSMYYNYKYYLVINYGYYMFDIRTKGWLYQQIKTESYQSQPVVLGVLNEQLYNGQENGYIEQEYKEEQYRNEDITAYVESAQIDVNSLYKYVESLKLWFISGVKDVLNVQVTYDDNTNLIDDLTFNLYGGAFDARYFNSLYFQTDCCGLNYKTININKLCRWIKHKLSCTSGACNLQGVEFYGQQIRNKE